MNAAVLPARTIAGLLIAAAAAAAQSVEIVNMHGAVSVEVVTGTQFGAWRAGDDPDEPRGLVMRRSAGQFTITAAPPDGASPDIEVRIPLGMGFAVLTDAGDVSITGMVNRARVRSERGSLAVAVPLDVTVVNLSITRRPQEFDAPKGRGVSLVADSISPRLQFWRATHSLKSKDLVYGSITGQLGSPAAVSLRDWPIPAEWPLKPHSYSKGAVDRLVARAQRRRAGGAGPPARAAPEPAAAALPSGSEGGALFTSEVRMVNLSVAVSDAGGRPMTGLRREDFAVEEDGAPQRIEVADAEEAPFNLAILLDLSGSTSLDLDHMRQAALRLIGMAGPNDRVALYAMAGSMFHRLAPLTSEREDLARRIGALPYPVGGSPLWDTVALAYDDELADRAGERNALIVISDGIDNRISGQSTPSMLRAARLIELASEMEARIYPIFLLSGERFARNWSARARTRMESLARQSGGRLFTARSVADIEPVLPQLAREMRSVYGIAYYPSNQSFDGSWRKVRIKVAVPGSRIRARPGYFAD